MDHNKVKILLNDYVDDILPHELVKPVEEHLLECKECNNFHLSLRTLLERASSIPDSIELPENLWPAIYSELREMEMKDKNLVDEEGKVRSFGELKGQTVKPDENEVEEKIEEVKIKKEKSHSLSKPIFLSLLIILLAAILYFFIFNETNPWRITVVSGTPTISQEKVTSNDKLSEDEILRTDLNSRASIKIPGIGSIHVGPNSSVRRIGDFNFRLTSGEIKASEDSSSEFLLIEIPSAQIKDFNLGNSFSLEVNSNRNSSIYVEKGWLKVSYANKEFLVPSKYYCNVKKDVGPGIPYSGLSTAAFKEALNKFSFGGDMESIPTILSESTQNDALSLWHLLQLADPKDRQAIFDRLSSFVEPPSDTNKEEILNLNKKMLISWLEKIDLQM